jgi:hypothetical protein
MIDFERLEREKDTLREQFLSAKPFPHIAIDNFLKPGCAEKLYADAADPDPKYKIKDPVFSKNRFQYPHYKVFSENYKELSEDVQSERFAKIISYITDADIFFDPDFHGGGLHIGTKNAHLDMHADFNYHPKHQNWYRYLNLLLYLNKDWKPEYGGSLKLEDARTGEKTEVEPLLNRLAIMHCREYTLHGYDTTHFPEGKYRTSVAIYGYTLHDKPIEKPRTTIWVDRNSPFKQLLAKAWLPAVAIKKKLFG